MNLIPWRKPKAEVLERDQQLLSVNQWAELLQSFSYQGVRYSLSGSSQEEFGGGLSGFGQGAYKANGVVFAVMAVRQLAFSEARFVFQRMRGGRPGDLWAPGAGNPLFGELALLDSPWRGATTGDLLSRMIQHADLAGNAFVARVASDRLMVLRPDWVTIVAGVRDNRDASAWDVDAEVLGYLYTEGGPGSGKDPVAFMPDQVAHFAPYPDPEARFRGMSWLTPIVREVMADKAATEHKLEFFENAATPNMLVKLDTSDMTEYLSWVKQFKVDHEGADNAYKTLFLAAGADATVIGANLQQMDFKVTQGAGETRIAAAGGVPPVLVGLSEGLAAATYSNYQQSSRRLADLTMRPLWRNAAASLASLVRVPSDSRLWYDDRDIQFLKEDAQDAAAVSQTKAATITTLVKEGFTAESSVAAVESGDMSLLEHTGLISVQLQVPGSQPAAPADIAPPSPPKRDDQMDSLDRELYALLRDARDDRDPVNVNVTMPEVRLEVPPSRITIEPQITVEPARLEIADGAFRIEAAPAPDVNVTADPAADSKTEDA